MNDEAKRVIKKYPNRRLYDTAESKYVTLNDVRKLVLDGVGFCVIDKKSGEDITRNILLQIIIGGVAGLGVVGKLYWHRLRGLFGLNKKEPQEEPPSAVK